MKILVVDDDPGLRGLVTLALERAGFAVVGAADGQQALTNAAREAPDLVVLDVGLPELDGFEVCRRLRARSQVPILFLTAQDDEVDRIVGLELGADDYVTKPFSPRELVARIRAILKRSSNAPGPRSLTHGMIELDLDGHACRVGGAPVALTATEIAILDKLVRNRGRILSRSRMVEDIWGPGSAIADRTLDSHLRNLRRKLALAGCRDAVETVHGIGVRLGPCAAC